MANFRFPAILTNVVTGPQPTFVGYAANGGKEPSETRGAAQLTAASPAKIAYSLKKSLPVDSYTPRIRRACDRMFRILRQSPGVFAAVKQPSSQMTLMSLPTLTWVMVRPSAKITSISSFRYFLILASVAISVLFAAKSCGGRTRRHESVELRRDDRAGLPIHRALRWRTSQSHDSWQSQTNDLRVSA